MRQRTVKPAWIGHALKRRLYWERQTRLIPSLFYMLSFHAFLKRKTVQRTLLQTDKIFSPQLKKTPCLTRTKKFQEFPRNRELNWIFLSIFSKKTIFYTSKQHFFLFQFEVLKECNSFDSNSLSFIPSCSLQPTNNCFCATESDIDLPTILHPFMNYWFQCCDLHQLWWSVLQKNALRLAEECTKLLADSFHCRHTYIR